MGLCPQTSPLQQLIPLPQTLTFRVGDLDIVHASVLFLFPISHSPSFPAKAPQLHPRAKDFRGTLAGPLPALQQTPLGLSCLPADKGQL